MKITYKEYIKYAEPNIFDEVFEDKSFKQAAKAAKKAQELNEKRALKKARKIIETLHNQYCCAGSSYATDDSIDYYPVCDANTGEIALEVENLEPDIKQKVINLLITNKQFDTDNGWFMRDDNGTLTCVIKNTNREVCIATIDLNEYKFHKKLSLNDEKRWKELCELYPTAPTFIKTRRNQNETLQFCFQQQQRRHRRNDDAGNARQT